MRKTFVLSASAFALVMALMSRMIKQEKHQLSSVPGVKISAPLRPGGEPERNLATEVAELETVAGGGDAGGLQKMGPPSLFPNGKVVSRASDPPDHEGRLRVIETVETKMKEPFVRVERTLRQDSLGNSDLESEVAMVANQLLLERPEGVGEDRFLEILHTAGAVEVKQMGEEAYLATFTAAPADPRALDGYIARVRELGGAELTIEPNYIRRLF